MKHYSGRHARRLMRQKKILRRWVAGASILVFIVLSLGMTELGLHGPGFFVFRGTGVGGSGPSAGQEAQGPGQPDANGKTGCIINGDGTCLEPVQTIKNVSLTTETTLPAGTPLSVECWWMNKKTMMYQFTYSNGTASVPTTDVNGPLTVASGNIPNPIPACPKG